MSMAHFNRVGISTDNIHLRHTMQCICKAFELETFPEKKLLVPCALTLNVLKVSPGLGNRP